MRAQLLVLFDHQKVNTQQTGNRKHTWVLITTINLNQWWTLSSGPSARMKGQESEALETLMVTTALAPGQPEAQPLPLSLRGEAPSLLPSYV